MSLFVRERAFYKSFLTLTFIIALQNLIAFGVNLTDSLMLGAYNELSLSGSAICNQVQFLMQMILGGIVTGMVVIASQYWGKRQTEPIKKIFAVAFWLALGLSFIVTVLCLAMPEQILRLLTNEPAVITEGARFLKIICLTNCIFAVTTVILGVLRSVETVKIGFWITLSTFVLNFIFNYLFIYGNFGMPRMGIRGSAVSTLIARTVELIIVLCYIAFADKKLNLRFKDILHIEKGYVKDFVKTGLPTVLSSASWGIAMGAQGAILGRLGASAIAASSIATTLFQIASIVAYGSSNASNVVIGKAIGRGDLGTVKQYAKTLQVLFIIIGFFTSFVLFGGKLVLLNFYNRVSAETKSLAGIFILVLCVTVIGTAYQMATLTGIVAGGGDTKFVLFNDLIFQWCIVLPAAALSAFVFKLPVVFTFACLKSDQILKCAVAIVKVNRYKWIKKLTRDSI